LALQFCEANSYLKLELGREAIDKEANPWKKTLMKNIEHF
jgi:hypothetical protein